MLALLIVLVILLGIAREIVGKPTPAPPAKRGES